MSWLRLLIMSVSVLFVSTLTAADHTIEPVKEKAPADAISKELLAKLADSGIRVKRSAYPV